MNNKRLIKIGDVLRRHRTELGLFALALLFSGIIAAIMPLPADDTALRYAPMAEAFAGGRFEYAWHPRFGVYFSSCAGAVVWLTGCSGFTACKILAVALFSLAVFPLYRLFEIVWDRNIALVSTALYVVCSHLLRLPADGLRDSGKTLALSLIALGLVELYRDRKNIRAGLFLVGGAVLLTVIRGEGAPMALAACLAGCFLVRDWRRILAGMVLFLLLLLPQLAYNFYAIGYPVTDVRHALYLRKAYRLVTGETPPAPAFPTPYQLPEP